MTQKYYKKLNAVIVPCREGSHIWRKMLECWDIIEHQITWHPKMGSSIFWLDNWIGLGALYFIVPPKFGIDENVHNVYDVLENWAWNVERLLEILLEELAHHIVQKVRPLVMENALDSPYWMLEPRAHFSMTYA